MCKRINIFYACLLGFYFAASVIFGIVIGATGMDLPYWAQCIVSQAFLLIPAFAYVIIYRINIYKCIPYRKIKPLDALLSILLGYMLIPVVLFINTVTMMFSTNYMNNTVSDLTSYPFVVQVLLMAVIPPMVEEFIFRGIIYHSYRRNGIMGAAVLSGLLFGVAHLNINQFCYAFVIGIVFALLVEATGSIWSAVLAHFAFNTYSITVFKIMSAAGIDVNAVQQQADSVTLSAGAAVVSSVMQLAVLVGMAAGFMLLAMLIIKKLAVRNGRGEYLEYNMRLGMRPRNGEHFFTAPLVVTIVLAFVYMIYTELVVFINSFIV